MTETVAQETAGYGWKEIYLGGSRTAENELIRKFAHRIKKIQARIRARQGDSQIRRAQHAKLLVGLTNAEFRIGTEVPADLRGGFFEPGAVYPAIVRFSNCSGAVQSDAADDLRGIAVRVLPGDGTMQDFLLTNAPASHARDPQQFMIVAEALSGPKVFVLPRLILGLGPREALRVLGVLRRGASRRVDSLATERYWNRCPIAFGSCAVKYLLQPAQVAPPSPAATGEDYLRDELVQRLKAGPVTFTFKVQRFVNEKSTPIEDVVVPWEESVAPLQTLAQLIIPQQDLTGTAGRQAAQYVDKLEFNPWNCVADFRPIGRMSRARRRVYEASAQHRTTGESW